MCSEKSAYDACMGTNLSELMKSWLVGHVNDMMKSWLVGHVNDMKSWLVGHALVVLPHSALIAFVTATEHHAG